MNEEVIKQKMGNESVKTFGVCANPQIEWNDQHECAKNKIQATIRKLMRIEMKMHQEHMHFNMHVLINVIF